MTENTENKNFSLDSVDKTLSLMEKAKAFLDKHGFLGIFATMLMLCLCSMVGYLMLNPKVMIEKVETIIQKAHSERIENRMMAEPQLRAYLSNLRADVGADRVFIMEPHNGSSNLSNLPFIYGDLTYAEPAGAFAQLETDYKNFRFSRYPLATKTFIDGSWLGNVEDLKEMDPEIYYRFKAEDISYIGMMTIYSDGILPSGILGIVYTTSEPESESVIRKEMQRYSTVISPLLSGKLNTKK